MMKQNLSAIIPLCTDIEISTERSVKNLLPNILNARAAATATSRLSLCPCRCNFAMCYSVFTSCLLGQHFPLLFKVMQICTFCCNTSPFASSSLYTIIKVKWRFVRQCITQLSKRDLSQDSWVLHILPFECQKTIFYNEVLFYKGSLGIYLLYIGQHIYQGQSNEAWG